MNLKHLSIGVILLIIGLTVLSPFEEIFLLVPFATSIGHPELIPAVTGIAILCLIAGIYLVGRSALMHYGMAGRAIAHHPVVILGVAVVICIVAYLYLA